MAAATLTEMPVETLLASAPTAEHVLSARTAGNADIQQTWSAKGDHQSDYDSNGGI